MTEGFLSNDWTVIAVMGAIVLLCLSLVGYIVKAIINGTLFTGPMYQQVVEERREWKNLAMANQETLHGQNETLGLQAATINKQAETGEAFTHMMDAIKAQAEGKP